MTKVIVMRGAAIAFVIGLCSGAPATAWAASDEVVADIVAHEMSVALPRPAINGLAVAVRVDGETRFFNYGLAEDLHGRPVTADTLFNLGSVEKVFVSALLADAARKGEFSLDDPVANFVTELQHGGDFRQVTLRQLASYSSGLVMPQDQEPWPQTYFTQPKFFSFLNQWHSDADHRPGQQMIYAHAGYMLLHIALERRFGMPINELMEERLLKPLGLDSTALPVRVPNMRAHPRGEIPTALRKRAVQGYSKDGEPVGHPGNLQGYYVWFGAGQMYSTARDLSVFLDACLGELPEHQSLYEAVKDAQQVVLPVRDEDFEQALAWEVRRMTTPTIVDKFGGLDNASAYIGMLPERKIGIVMLGNRGGMNIVEAGRAIMLKLAAQDASTAH
jgi:beta-lactamase class C